MKNQNDSSPQRRGGAEKPKGNPLLIGQAEVHDLVKPAVRRMLDRQGFYIALDARAPKADVPLVSIGGKVFAMKYDQELDPTRFVDGVQFMGPFRNGEITCVWCGCTDSYACEGGCSWAEKHRSTPTGVCDKCKAEVGR